MDHEVAQTGSGQRLAVDPNADLGQSFTTLMDDLPYTAMEDVPDEEARHTLHDTGKNDRVEAGSRKPWNRMSLQVEECIQWDDAYGPTAHM